MFQRNFPAVLNSTYTINYNILIYKTHTTENTIRYIELFSIIKISNVSHDLELLFELSLIYEKRKFGPILIFLSLSNFVSILKGTYLYLR